MKALWCYGYLDGIESFKAYYDALLRRGERALYCVPENVTKDQKIRVVVKHLNDHPEKLHDLAILSTIEALSKAFPCK